MLSRNYVLSFFALAGFILMLGSFSFGPDRLKQIKAKGELVVLTRNAATTYYESREGKLGIEYEMAKAFADSIGVDVRFVIKDNVADLFEAIRNGHGDLVAAGLTQTDEREKEFIFGPSYQTVSQQLVCRRGGKQPRTVEDLVGISLQVSVDSSYIVPLNEAKIKYPEISWQEVEDTDTETLLKDVWSKKIDCTIAYENIVAINRRYLPELTVRFDMTKPKPLAWVMPSDADSLQDELGVWFDEFVASGKHTEVMHRYYGYIERFDYVDARTYQRKIKSHLPAYKKIFKHAAKQYGVTWTLLAAQAYQESHWKINAQSTTGVRGIMMLTRATATELGITDRLNPTSSIMGGAYYLNKLRKRLPETVTEPDRTWLALAAYNVGMGHIWDGRKLAKELNKNPDLWQEMAEVLPLLSKKKYYKNLKHGYARGDEPVNYVNNIRNYQDVLENVMKENPL